MLETLSLPPAEQRIKLREKMVEGLKEAFPIQGSKFSLHMENPTVHEREYSANEQKEALLTGRSLTEPIKGNLILKDADGKVVDRSKQVTLLNLPWMTERATYITNGNENSVASQLRLKPGVYCRRRGNEELEASWNLAKGRNFRIALEPEHGILNMEFQTSKIPLYPILKSLGVSHEEIAKAWGKELANKNDEKHGKKAEASVEKLYQKLIPDFAQKPLDHAGRVSAIKEYYGKTVMDPKVNEETLGIAADKVTPEAMLKASGKLLNIFKNSADIDDRNSIAFKTHHSGIDFLKENLGFAAKELNRKIRFKLDHAGHEPTLAKVVPPSMFSDHIKSFITKSDVSTLPTQINPMEISDSANKITLMGEGGISSESAVPDEVRELHPSQFGILDAVRTPECHSGDTEVYTRNGWKLWPEVSMDDELACRIDGKLEFHKPLRLIKQKYTGIVYGVKNGKIEYLVTPNHRMLCRSYTAPGKSAWKMDTADNVHNKNRTFDAGHEPLEFTDYKSHFTLPTVTGSNSVINVPPIPIDDWSEFMGWYISEGCCSYKESVSNVKNSCSYRVRISQDKIANPTKCTMIENLLQRLPFKWSREKSGYVIGVKQLAHYLKDFGFCYDKYIPEYLLEAPLSAREKLFQALLLGNGRTYSKRSDAKKSYLQQVYTTTSPQLAKDFERLAISLGHSTRTAVYEDKRQERYLPVYEIRVLKHRERTAINRKGHFYTQEYDDYVYCAEVPGHLLYTRRNNSVPIWLGNSGKVGVDIRATISAFRDDAGNLYTVVLNRKTGKLEHLSAAELHKKNVAFPMKDFPKSGKVDVVHRGQIFSKPVSEVDYIIPHANFLYSTTTNLIPFPESSQGNRLIMASKMQTQALPLKEREEPWVQVASWRKGKTMESEMGEQATPNSPVKGKITKIDKDFIYIAPSHVKHGAAGKKDEIVKVPYYTDFPLASKTYLHHDLNVKEGDKVEEGQQLGESNFTRNGKLALGKNMNVAFLAYNGLNSNDGIVISEDAAKKLTSVGMYKHVFEPDANTKAGKDTHRVYFGNKYTDENYKVLDDEGVVKKGQTIHPGDPLIVSISKKEPSPQDAMLGKLSKSLLKPYRDSSMTWDGEFSGKVIDVIKGPKRTTITVQTEEPMVLGDKLCYDAETEVLTKTGWKPVSKITLDDEVCTLQKGDNIEYLSPTAVYQYPTGGRMYHIESSQVDLLVTDAHSMYVRPINHDTFSLIAAKDIANKSVEYKKDGIWRGKTPEYMTFPAMTIKFRRGTRILPEIKMTPQVYLMLLGAYLSEGSLKSKAGTAIQIAQKKISSRELFEKELIRSGIPYRAYHDRYVISSRQLTEHFRQFGHSGDKFIPLNVFDWEAADLKILLKWLAGGDGYKNSSNIFCCYTSASKRLADDVQRLALHVGLAGNVKLDKIAQYKTIRGKTYFCNKVWDVRIIHGTLTPQVIHYPSKKRKRQKEEFIENYDKPVYCLTVPGHILYVRRNGKPVWSGNCGRYGNKGVVSAIIPDDRMPRDAKGNPIDVLLTSAGVISRVNPAQVIEMAVAKVAKEKGKPIAVESFSGKNNVEWAKKLLRDNGLSDKETVYNPVTGKNISNIAVGPMYLYKLFKTTKSNYSSHGVGPGYDVNEQPLRGGEEGAKGMGRMEISSLIAHNARNILKENAVLKSQKNDEFWQRYRLGLPLPTLKPAFAYNKFLSMLQGSGIKVKKTNDNLILAPLTDSDVDELSSGKITSKEFVRAKDLKPSDGGFFDPNITGGLSGTKWSHIQLSEPVLNPIFHDSARRLLGLTSTGLDTMLKTDGAKHVEKLLGDIDLSSRSRSLKLQLPNLKGTKFDDAVKTLKYIKALKENDLTPDKAYILHKIPVVPPIFRPILPGHGGRMQVSDANSLYRDCFLANESVVTAKDFTAKEKEMAREHLNDSVGALFGLREPVSPQNSGRGVKGFLSLIAGQGSPKFGFFQSKVLKKNLDLTGRATVAPDINLGMDELGIPEGQLWNMFEPFISRRLIRNGRTALEAKKMIEEQSPAARDAMIAETKERPVLFNRAPTLHKYNIIAGYPVPVQGKTLRVPATWAEKAQNLDFDGDAGSLHVPVMPQAVEEAKKMTLSNLVMANRDKSLMVKPEMESVIGTYFATSAKETGKRVTRFDSIEDAENAYKRGTLQLGDKVEIS